ncbi:MAG: hypothetical protein II274_01140 [Alistipes sp.]|jgi:hypothetical protein|nr:hypothetical protein [Alistipes sp.]
MKRVVMMLGVAVALTACGGNKSEIVISEQNATNMAYDKSFELATKVVEAADYESFRQARAELEAYEQAFREQVGGEAYLIFLEESSAILND